MESPNLVEIKSLVVNNIKQNEFTLNVSLKAQKVEEAPNMKKVGAQ
jgi:type IV pilus assembly protein PilN